MIYVDPLHPWGWKMHGKTVDSCHMITDQADLAELHEMAQKIGLKRAWFQDKPGRPHYDLTKSRRDVAVECGAVQVSSRQALKILQERDILIKKGEE